MFVNEFQDQELALDDRLLRKIQVYFFLFSHVNVMAPYMIFWYQLSLGAPLWTVQF